MLIQIDGSKKNRLKTHFAYSSSNNRINNDMGYFAGDFKQ